MKIRNEIMTKVNRLKEIQAEEEQICSELVAEFKSSFDGCYIEDFSIVDEPSGEDDGDGQYCDQWTGYFPDSGSGTYYYPIENSTKYLAISYTF